MEPHSFPSLEERRERDRFGSSGRCRPTATVPEPSQARCLEERERHERPSDQLHRQGNANRLTPPARRRPHQSMRINAASQIRPSASKGPTLTSRAFLISFFATPSTLEKNYFAIVRKYEFAAQNF